MEIDMGVKRVAEDIEGIGGMTDADLERILRAAISEFSRHEDSTRPGTERIGCQQMTQHTNNLRPHLISSDCRFCPFRT